MVLHIQTKAQQIFDLRTAVCAFCLRIVNLKQRVTIMLVQSTRSRAPPLHGNPKGYNQGLRPCMLVLLLFLLGKNKNKHACLGFASLPKGDVNICLGNVNLKKLKTHNKKQVSHILCP